MRLAGRSPAAVATFAAVWFLAASPGDAAPARSKKEQLLEDKSRARTAHPGGSAAERESWRKALRRRLGRKPPELVNIYNTWTHEFVAVEVDRAASAPPPELVNRFLRCHFTNQESAMDVRLFDVLLAAARSFKVTRVDIVSGFRSPKYNLMLRKKGRRVARNSEHTLGHAVDFRLPGISTERVRRWARRMRLGGVGYYEDDDFVHVDTGPVRYWAE